MYMYVMYLFTAVHAVPTPIVIISPSGFIQGAVVGSFELIKCILSTVSGVESSSVMISWRGPGGNTIMNNARITIRPITFRGNTYTESLRFEYLAEGDNGTYTCNVMILDTSNTQSLKLQSLIGNVYLHLCHKMHYSFITFYFIKPSIYYYYVCTYTCV